MTSYLMTVTTFTSYIEQCAACLKLLNCGIFPFLFPTSLEVRCLKPTINSAGWAWGLHIVFWLQ